MNIVFRHTALEVVDFIYHIEDIIGGDILFCAEKSKIRYIDFERIDIPVVVERLFDLLDPVDLRHDAGQAEPFDRVFKFGSPCALLQQLILEAGIRF